MLQFISVLSSLWSVESSNDNKVSQVSLVLYAKHDSEQLMTSILVITDPNVWDGNRNDKYYKKSFAAMREDEGHM